MSATCCSLDPQLSLATRIDQIGPVIAVENPIEGIGFVRNPFSSNWELYSTFVVLAHLAETSGYQENVCAGPD